MQQNSPSPYLPFSLMEQGNRYPVDLPEGLDESHYCSCCGVEGQGAGAVADDTELQDFTSSVSSTASQLKHLHKLSVLMKHRMSVFMTRKT